jgi:hypothetical protein
LPDVREPFVVAVLHALLQILRHRLTAELTRLVSGQARQAAAHHLGVASLAQNPREPLELLAKRGSDVASEHRLERRQGTSQPSDRHAHLVHRVWLVCAHLWVPALELLNLRTKVGEQHHRGRPVRRRLAFDHVLGRGKARSERPRQLGGSRRRASRCRQHGLLEG